MIISLLNTNFIKIQFFSHLFKNTSESKNQIKKFDSFKFLEFRFITLST